jgi:RNA polymerase-binding protein DksA
VNELEISELKLNLEAERQSLYKQLDALKNDKTRKKGAITADFEDQSQETENDQVVDKLESMETERLEKIEAALERIQSGQYGVCVDCNKAISSSRIKALPFAAKCIDCN